MAECNALALVIGSASGMYNAAEGQYLHSSAYINGGAPTPPPAPPPPPTSPSLWATVSGLILGSDGDLSKSSGGNSYSQYALSVAYVRNMSFDLVDHNSYIRYCLTPDSTDNSMCSDGLMFGLWPDERIHTLCKEVNQGEKGMRELGAS